MQAQSDTWGKKDHDFLYRMIMMTLIVSFHNNKKKKKRCWNMTFIPYSKQVYMSQSKDRKHNQIGKDVSTCHV